MKNQEFEKRRAKQMLENVKTSERSSNIKSNDQIY